MKLRKRFVKTFSRRFMWQFLPGLQLALLMASPLFMTTAYAQQTTKRVLVFSNYDSYRPGVVALNRALRSTVKDGSPGPVEFFYEAQAQEIPINEFEQELVGYLRRKYASEKFDLIITLGAPSLKFLARHQTELFPDTPRLFFVFDEREDTARSLMPNITGIWVKLDIAETLEIALALHPETQRVVVVSNQDDNNTFLREQARSELKKYESKVEIAYPNNLTIEELKDTLAALPKNTIVLFVEFLRDRVGSTFSNQEALSKIAPTSSAPIYGIAETYIGAGVVGGSVTDFEVAGARTGEMTLRILAGERPQDISPQRITSQPVFDWRELRRWGISEDRLPPRSIVRFRVPSVWDQYKWYLLGIIFLILLQSALISGLLINRSRRKRAEEGLTKEKEILEKIFDNIPVMISFVDADGRIKLVNHEWERTLGWSLEEIRQQNLDIFAECYPDPQDRQQVLTFVADAKGKWAEFKARARDGRVIETTFVRVQLSDGTRIGIGQDITERKRAEETLAERLRFETLLTELSAAFANMSADEVDREIDRWLQTLAEFLGVDRASFLQFEEDWTTVNRTHSYTVSGIEPLPPAPTGLDVQFPWITAQLRRGITVKWSRIPDDMSEEAVKEREYAARLGVKSGLNIPVRVGGSVIGAIAFTSIANYRDWPDAMVVRLRLVGEIFATGVVRKRAEEHLKATGEQLRALSGSVQAARDEEATRIAREIHDELGGSLTSLKWELEDIDEPDLETGARPDLLEQRKKVLSMVSLIDATINTVRRIASELRPIGLDDLGLVSAIELHARKFQDRSGIIVECDCALPALNLSQEQSTAIFRIFQEALTNALRHSQATRVEIKTTEEAGEFILRIADNGRGITDQERSGKHTLGLLGMRERANLIGASIKIIGSAGKGTVVTLRISTRVRRETEKANESHLVS